jgi:hypothetical protein
MGEQYRKSMSSRVMDLVCRDDLEGMQQLLKQLQPAATFLLGWDDHGRSPLLAAVQLSSEALLREVLVHLFGGRNCATRLQNDQEQRVLAEVVPQAICAAVRLRRVTNLHTLLHFGLGWANFGEDMQQQPLVLACADRGCPRVRVHMLDALIAGGTVQDWRQRDRSLLHHAICAFDRDLVFRLLKSRCANLEHMDYPASLPMPDICMDRWADDARRRTLRGPVLDSFLSGNVADRWKLQQEHRSEALIARAQEDYAPEERGHGVPPGPTHVARTPLELTVALRTHFKSYFKACVHRDNEHLAVHMHDLLNKSGALEFWLDIARQLLKSGADPEGHTDVHDTPSAPRCKRRPLMLAVQAGDTDLVQLLLESSAKPMWCEPRASAS